jgi:hypothetical protein
MNFSADELVALAAWVSDQPARVAPRRRAERRDVGHAVHRQRARLVAHDGAHDARRLEHARVLDADAGQRGGGF